MRFTWDPAKSAANVAARRFDFAFATLVFDSLTLNREDTREDYGERRIAAIGLASDLTLTVVYTDRIADDGEVERRIISARRSSRRERKAYETFKGA